MQTNINKSVKIIYTAMDTYYIRKEANYDERWIRIIVEPVDRINDLIDNDDILDSDFNGIRQAVKFGRVFVKAYETFYPDFDIRLIILN